MIARLERLGKEGEMPEGPDPRATEIARQAAARERAKARDKAVKKAQEKEKKK